MNERETEKKWNTIFIESGLTTILPVFMNNSPSDYILYVFMQR